MSVFRVASRRSCASFLFAPSLFARQQRHCSARRRWKGQQYQRIATPRTRCERRVNNAKRAAAEGNSGTGMHARAATRTRRSRICARHAVPVRAQEPVAASRAAEAESNAGQPSPSEMSTQHTTVRVAHMLHPVFLFVVHPRLPCSCVISVDRSRGVDENTAVLATSAFGRYRASLHTRKPTQMHSHGSNIMAPAAAAMIPTRKPLRAAWPGARLRRCGRAPSTGQIGCRSVAPLPCALVRRHCVAPSRRSVPLFPPSVLPS